MRFLSLTLAVLALAAPALACPLEAVQGGYCAEDLQVQAQVQAYAAPVQAVAVQSYVQPVQQVRVVQRVVQPQAVYVQPQAVVLRQKAYVQQQVVQQRVVTPYVQQQVAVQDYGSSVQLNSSSYGSQQLNLGSRQRLNLGGGSQRSVVKSRTVTKSGSSGVLGRLLGR